VGVAVGLEDVTVGDEKTGVAVGDELMGPVVVLFMVHATTTQTGEIKTNPRKIIFFMLNAP
jgi:hypothetical protein